MDLKGSLINTNLKIYPSEKLTNFLQTLKDSENIPINILKLGKSENCKLKEYKNDNIANKASLTDKDITKLKELKKAYASLKKTENHEDRELSETSKKNEDPDLKQKPKIDEKKSEENESKLKDEENVEGMKGSYLTTFDIDWLYSYLKKRKSNGDRNIPYLHELLEGSNIEMPENQTITRNPDLEARCVKLRAQQEAREYKKMTKSVDNVRMRFPDDSISYQLKQVNRQLIAIGQFIISIFAGFLFGFKGIEWMIGPLDFGFKLLLGVMCALVIALAEIYFLAKKLNEELNVPETLQLGGPPKFANAPNYPHTTTSNKEHQD